MLLCRFNRRREFMKGTLHHRRRSLLSSALLFILLLCVICWPSGSFAQKKAAPNPGPAASAPAAAPAQPGQPAINAVTQTAMQSGVQACAGRINQVTNFLTAGTQGGGAFLFLPPVNPDRQMVSVSMEIPMSPATVAYASASFAPNQANGCGGMYETVVYWPQDCATVARTHYGNLKVTGGLAQHIAVLDAGPMTRIFLMPAGTGCVSIKKEVVQ